MSTWSVAPRRCFRRRLVRLGTDRNPFLHELRVCGRSHLNLLYALHHDTLAGLQAFGDNPVRSHSCAHLDGPKHRLVLGCDHNDLIERLHLDNRRLRYEQRVLLLSRLNANLSEAARTQDGVRVRKLGSDLDGSCTSRNLAIDLDHPPSTRVVLSVRLNICHWSVSRLTAAKQCGNSGRNSEVSAFGDVEVDPDWVHLGEGGHLRGGSHQVANL